MSINALERTEYFRPDPANRNVVLGLDRVVAGMPTAVTAELEENRRGANQ